MGPHGERLRVLLADDSPAVIDEIAKVLGAEHTIVSRVGDGATLVRVAARLRPDVIVSDLNMPGMNGIEAGRRIVAGGMCGSFILLTVYADLALVQTAIAAGIRGYVLKADAGEELCRAVETVMAGSTYLSRGLPR